MGNISSVLKAKRKELGLTLAQIAEKIGVTEATVQRWESGNIKSLRHERIAKLADILGVTPSVLMGWDEPTAPTLPSPTITEDTVTFPVITSVAAHYDGVSIDESAAGEKIEVPRAYLKGRKAEDFCAMRVRGDSMYPAFQNGDIVLVLRQSTIFQSTPPARGATAELKRRRDAWEKFQSTPPARGATAEITEKTPEISAMCITQFHFCTKVHKVQEKKCI